MSWLHCQHDFRINFLSFSAVCQQCGAEVPVKRAYSVGLYMLAFLSLLPAYFAKGFWMNVLAILVYLIVLFMVSWGFSWLVNRMPPEMRLRFLLLEEIHKP